MSKLKNQKKTHTQNDITEMQTNMKCMQLAEVTQHPNAIEWKYWFLKQTLHEWQW
jgi:hypothetical protein